ncbi:hypothetical protein JOC86_000678 [Bacillus pakistanensis]|uniref:Uncharacterized protein n=1 Tax=Rossellomorea pakistanensis TaxID=992288 RepID=A0ABS2N9A2_9BACI|nr:hypothetical protein [Bacillus pakistanensis]MBM7584141.1 hypothetical protein [Bacillus pakistanensis]
MPVSVVFNQINVNSVQIGSSVATGQNSINDWNTQGKSNLGNGIETGIIYKIGISNVIIDTDAIDSTISEPEIINPQPTILF